MKEVDRKVKFYSEFELQEICLAEENKLNF